VPGIFSSLFPARRPRWRRTPVLFSLSLAKQFLHFIPLRSRGLRPDLSLFRFSAAIARRTRAANPSNIMPKIYLGRPTKIAFVYIAQNFTVVCLLSRFSWKISREMQQVRPSPAYIYKHLGTFCIIIHVKASCIHYINS
jgi:hypothetical protein